MKNNKSEIIPAGTFSISDLEKMGNTVEILPNGDIKKKKRESILKPLTFKKNLGGEYAA